MKSDRDIKHYVNTQFDKDSFFVHSFYLDDNLVRSVKQVFELNYIYTKLSHVDLYYHPRLAPLYGWVQVKRDRVAEYVDDSLKKYLSSPTPPSEKTFSNLEKISRTIEYDSPYYSQVIHKFNNYSWKDYVFDRLPVVNSWLWLRKLV